MSANERRGEDPRAKASLVAVVAILLLSSVGGPALAEHVDPIVLDEDNPKCSDVIDDPDIIELKVEPPENGTFTDGTLVVTISNLTDGQTFDWSSNFGVDGVVVKSGSTDHHFYDYRPEEETSDTNLTSADKHDISHISFCYDTEPVSTLDKAVRNVDDGTAFSDDVEVDPGDTIEFRLTYNNTGSADATNVTITDQVPSNSTFVSCSDDCSVDGDGGPGTTLTWSLGTVAPDDPALSVTFQVVLDDDFPTGTTTIDNVASASTDEEGSLDSNAVSVDVTVLPDSTLEKAIRNVDREEAFSTNTTADTGDTIEFRLTYNNTGNANATDVTITDAVVDRSTFVSCSDDCTVDGDGGPGSTVTWTLGTVTPDDEPIAVTFQVQLDPTFPNGTTVVPNTGTVDTAEEENTTESNEVTVAISASPASVLEKAVRNLEDGGTFGTTTTAEAGDTIEYQLTYTNDGDANATDVTLTDAVPERSTFVSCSDDCTVDGDGGPGTELTWQLGTVEPGQSVPVTFRVQLDSTFPNGTTVIPNTATADTAEEDDATESNEVTTEVDAAPVSVLEKAVRNVDTDSAFERQVTAEPGDTIEFRLTYNNTGTANATNVTITDQVPSNSAFVSCSDDCTVDGDGGPGTNLTWELGTVAPGDDPIAVTFQVQLDDTFPAGTTEIPNTATADSDEEPPTDSNEVVVVVSAEADLHLRKEADQTTVSPGDPVTYTLTFWNTGDADATDTTITETVPDGTSFVACTDDCTRSGDTITWDIGTVPAHTTENDPAGNVTLTVQIDTQNTCEICNTATITSPDDPDAPVDSNQECIRVGANPDAADTTGHSLGLGVTVPDLGLDETIAEVETAQSGVGTDNSSTTHLELTEDDTAGLASATVLTSSSRSTVDDQTDEATTTATSEVANVSLLDGLITARTVRAVATATTTGHSAATSTTGSTFENLTVNGVAIDQVRPNTRIELPAEFGEGSHVVLYETDTDTTTPPDGTLTGGTYTATTNVTMIHVVLTDALPAVPGDQPAELTISQADAGSSFPQTPLCEDDPQQAVQGHAYIASATTEPSLAPVREGFVAIEPTGGDEHQVLEAVDLAEGTVTASTAETRSQGQLLADESTAESRATVAEACLVPADTGCLVDATGIETTVTATADASTAEATGTTTIANLTVAGTDLCTTASLEDRCTPAPNTVIELDGIGFVVLNEQIPGASQAGHASLTVRAIHLVVTVEENPLDVPLGTEIIVAESHAGATFDAA